MISVPKRSPERFNTETRRSRSAPPLPSSTPFHRRAASQILASRSRLADITSRGAGRPRAPSVSPASHSDVRFEASPCSMLKARASNASEKRRERRRMSESVSGQGSSRNDRHSPRNRRSCRSRPRSLASSLYPSPVSLISHDFQVKRSATEQRKMDRARSQIGCTRVTGELSCILRARINIHRPVPVDVPRAECSLGDSASASPASGLRLCCESPFWVPLPRVPPCAATCRAWRCRGKARCSSSTVGRGLSDR